MRGVVRRVVRGMQPVERPPGVVHRVPQVMAHEVPMERMVPRAVVPAQVPHVMAQRMVGAAPPDRVPVRHPSPMGDRAAMHQPVMQSVVRVVPQVVPQVMPQMVQRPPAQLADRPVTQRVAHVMPDAMQAVAPVPMHAVVVRRMVPTVPVRGHVVVRVVRQRVPPPMRRRVARMVCRPRGVRPLVLVLAPCHVSPYSSLAAVSSTITASTSSRPAATLAR